MLGVGTFIGTGSAKPSFAPAVNPVFSNLFAGYNFDNSPNDTQGVNNGTLINAPSYTTGKVNQCLTFNGTTQYVSLPDNMFKPTGDFSIAAWAYFDGVGDRAIFSTYMFPSMSGVLFQQYAGTNLYFACMASGTSLTAAITTGWHHVVATRKGSTRNRIYIDGSLANSDTNVTNPTYLATQYTTIGVSRYAAASFAFYWNDKIDAVQLWDNYELTASDVTTLYNSGNGLQP